MATDRQGTVPSDAVSVGVLVVAAMDPLTMDGITRALTHIGAPSWRPLGDVVVGVIHRLCDVGLLENVTAGRESDRFATTKQGRALLPELLYALPLSGASPDAGYKLKVVGLDVLDAAARERQLQALLGHWRELASLWQEAEHRCPCRQASVRGWMQHNLDLARSEIEWLTAARS
ncbi:hypothetical protein [Reyranella sp.]|uniref:hypothetical protein n=1 Tax=Reyranella sp. TaxID=1929291 RepID=UPI003783CA00